MSRVFAILAFTPLTLLSLLAAYIMAHIAFWAKSETERTPTILELLSGLFEATPALLAWLPLSLSTLVIVLYLAKLRVYWILQLLHIGLWCLFLVAYWLKYVSQTFGLSGWKFIVSDTLPLPQLAFFTILIAASLWGTFKLRKISVNHQYD